MRYDTSYYCHLNFCSRQNNFYSGTCYNYISICFNCFLIQTVLVPENTSFHKRIYMYLKNPIRIFRSKKILHKPGFHILFSCCIVSSSFLSVTKKYYIYFMTKDNIDKIVLYHNIVSYAFLY